MNLQLLKKLLWSKKPPYDGESSFIKKLPIIKENTFCCRTKPSIFHLPFKKRFLSEDHSPSSKVIFTPKTKLTLNFPTQSPLSKDLTWSLKTTSFKQGFFTLATSTLVSCARCLCSLIPNRRAHRYLLSEKARALVKKTPSSHVDVTPSETSLSRPFCKIKLDNLTS